MQRDTLLSLVHLFVLGSSLFAPTGCKRPVDCEAEQTEKLARKEESKDGKKSCLS